MTTKNTRYPIATTYKYNNIDFPINFKSEINIAEMGALVQSIAGNVVDEDGYYPYLHDCALYSGILSAFSDFDTTDIIALSQILNASNLQDVIAETVGVYGDILTFVDEAIEYQKQKLANKSEFNGLISDIWKIIADVNDRLIKPMDTKTFEKLVKNLGAMKLTEKGLVDALIQAKVIDKKFSEKETKRKIINFAGQQMLDGTELKEDEME